MNYAIIDGETIVRSGSAQQLWPDTSFRTTGPGPSWLAETNAVKIRSDLPHDPATHQLVATDPYLLNGEVWDRVSVELAPVEPEPNWIGFQAAISTAPGVGALLATCLSPEVASMGGAQIYGGMVVGLGQIATGGSVATFLTAWDIAQALGMVGPHLITEMLALAEPFNLPTEFIEALNPVI